MKKFYILILNLIVGLSIYANPISEPTIEISELYFDNSGNWKLELQYFNYDYIEMSFDSVFIYSSTDTARIPDNFFEFDATTETAFIIITQDSLNSEFNLNKLGDTLKLVTYYSSYPTEDILIFGNVSGASIGYPKTGQSVSKYSNFFVKDSSPTIGEANDTLGVMGTIRGIVYDKNMETVADKILNLEIPFETSENGEYSARVYSRSKSISSISQKTSNNSWHKISITNISYTMEPDSVIEMDIYLQDSLYSGINDMELSSSPIKIFPNPISSNEKLNVNIDLPIETSDIYLEIFDMNGKLYRKTKIIEKTNTINMPSKTGLYLINIRLDSKTISSSKILVNE